MKIKRKKLTIEEKNKKINDAADRSAIMEDKSVYKTLQSKMNYEKFEDDKADSITKEKFINLLEKTFDFKKLTPDGEIEFIEKICSKKKQSNEEYYKFNLFIKKLHDNGVIDIIDSMKFMLEEYLEKNNIVYCLNENNLFELRKLLAQKYKIKLNSNLFWFIEKKN